MIRAQCIVHRGGRILMVRHCLDGVAWWCLPGGGVNPAESPRDAAVRELQEECCVAGTIVRQTSHLVEWSGTESITFLLDIGTQEPKLGFDPEFDHQDQVLTDMRWLSLSEICERDRAYLWAAGLLCIEPFLDELSGWGDEISYPGD